MDIICAADEQDFHAKGVFLGVQRLILRAGYGIPEDGDPVLEFQVVGGRQPVSATREGSSVVLTSFNSRCVLSVNAATTRDDVYAVIRNLLTTE